MRSGSFRPVLFLVPAILLAQQPSERPPEKASIEGFVVKAGTGEPVRKARLSLQKAEGRQGPFASHSAVTDAAGHFVIHNIEPGRYRLWTERTGYVRQEYGQRSPSPTRPGTPLALDRGQHLHDIVFRLVANAVITGRVVDEDREPVPNARVQAMRHSYAQGRRQLMPVGMATTNDLGEYRLHSLAPGRYYISAMYSRGGFGDFIVSTPETTGPSVTAAPEERYTATYYPGAVDPNAAVAVEAFAGNEVRGIDINLQLVRVVSVRGRVMLAGGQPARTATVNLWPRDAGLGFMLDGPARMRSGLGFFELLDVRPGSYYLNAQLNEEGKRYSARAPLDVGNSNIENLELILTPGFDLPGRIRIEAGARAQLDQLTVFLQRQDSLSFSAEGRTKADGSFVLQGVTRGTYWVGLSGTPADLYLKSARLGDDDVLDAGLDLSRAEAPPGPLDLVLSSGAGQVEGVVLDEKDKPAAGAQVVLIPESRRRTRTLLYQSAVTDQNGRFVLRGVPPGEYKLFAWEDVEPGAYQDPEFLKPYEARGETCKIQPGSSQTVPLKLIPAGGAP